MTVLTKGPSRGAIVNRAIVLCTLAVAVIGGCVASADRGVPAENWGVERLMEELGGDVPARRLEAAKALAGKEPGVVPVLSEALVHEDWKVRRGATDALGEMKAEARGAVAALTEALEDENAWVRDGAATALGSIGPEAESATLALREALGDEDLWVRESAIRALTAITKDKEILLPAAVVALGHGETAWNVRRYAVDILWRHGKEYEPAIPALIHTLDNPAEGMWQDCAYHAMDLLAGMADRSEEIVSVLAKVIENTDSRMRLRAAQALGKIGPAAKGAIPALENVAENDGEEEVRSAAKEALERILISKP